MLYFLTVMCFSYSEIIQIVLYGRRNHCVAQDTEQADLSHIRRRNRGAPVRMF
jgi:hypothetical protein